MDMPTYNPVEVKPPGRVTARNTTQAMIKLKFQRLNNLESRKRALISEKPESLPARLRLASPMLELTATC